MLGRSRKRLKTEEPRLDPYGSADYAGLDYDDPGAHGQGAFFGFLATKPWTYHYKPGWFGRRPQKHYPEQFGPPIYSQPERNTLICAPAGAGKGTTVIIPTLLSYQSSVFTIDPKGENAHVTALARRDGLGQTVHILNPWGLHSDHFAARGFKPARINPLELLDPADPEAVSNASFLADLLVIPSQGPDPFWNDSARTFIRGLLLYTAAYETEKTLATVRRLSTQGDKDMGQMLSAMAASELFSGVLAQTGHQFGGLEARTFSNVLANVHTNLDFLADPIIRDAMECSDFSFADLKARPATVYVIVPTYALDTQARWLRLMVGLALSEFERPPLYSHRSLFLIDEFAALGKMQKIQTGVATLRGFGVDMALVIQDLGQLHNLYDKGASTILANCQFKHFMRLSDVETAEYLSKLLGSETVRVRTQNEQGSSIGLAEAPLEHPHSLLQGPDDRGYLSKSGSGPVRLAQTPYWEVPVFAAAADTHPAFPGDARPADDGPPAEKAGGWRGFFGRS